jgi:hypothetical protein
MNAGFRAWRDVTRAQASADLFIQDCADLRCCADSHRFFAGTISSFFISLG